MQRYSNLDTIPSKSFSRNAVKVNLCNNLAEIDWDSLKPIQISYLNHSCVIRNRQGASQINMEYILSDLEEFPDIDSAFQSILYHKNLQNECWVKIIQFQRLKSKCL